MRCLHWDTWGNWDQIKRKESISHNCVCIYYVQNNLLGCWRKGSEQYPVLMELNLQWFTSPISSKFQGNNIYWIIGEISYTIFLFCAITQYNLHKLQALMIQEDSCKSLRHIFVMSIRQLVCTVHSSLQWAKCSETVKSIKKDYGKSKTGTTKKYTAVTNIIWKTGLFFIPRCIKERYHTKGS